jgi:hypothetical protein
MYLMNACVSGISPGGFTSAGMGVSIELIAVSVVEEALVVDVVVSAVVPESLAVQATPNVIRNTGTSDRIFAL